MNTETPHQAIDKDIETHQFESVNLDIIDYVYRLAKMMAQEKR